MSKAAVELRNSLKVAAMAAYLNGATDKQIDMIVALAKGSGDYNVSPGGHLTRVDATHIIDFMLSNGAEPDWEISDEEWDAEDEAKAEIEKLAAGKKIRKDQKKEEKAARDAKEAERTNALANSDGRKVRHDKFGIGTVIAEDAKSLTVAFPGQPKPLRVVPSFVHAV